MDFDTLDMVTLDTLGSADLDMERFLSGSDVEVDPFDLIDPFAPDEPDSLDTLGA